MEVSWKEHRFNINMAIGPNSCSCSQQLGKKTLRDFNLRVKIYASCEI